MAKRSSTSTASLSGNSKVDIVDQTVRGWIRAGVTMGQISAGLNNAFFHGEIFEENDIECSDKSLAELYDKVIKPLYDVAKHIR